MIQQQPMQALAAANAANIDTMRSLAYASIKAAERLMSLNLGFARSSLQQGVGVQPHADWQQMLSLQGSGFQKSAAEAADYLRSVYEISAEAQADVNEAISSRVDNLGEAVTSVLDVLARTAPPGSEKAMNMIRSAFADSCSAYTQMVVRTTPQAANNGQAARKSRKG
jgi:phasin family protein